MVFEDLNESPQQGDSGTGTLSSILTVSEIFPDPLAIKGPRRLPGYGGHQHHLRRHAPRYYGPGAALAPWNHQALNP